MKKIFEKVFLNKTFGKYLSKDIINEIVNKSEMGDYKKIFEKKLIYLIIEALAKIKIT